MTRIYYKFALFVLMVIPSFGFANCNQLDFQFENTTNITWILQDENVQPGSTINVPRMIPPQGMVSGTLEAFNGNAPDAILTYTQQNDSTKFFTVELAHDSCESSSGVNRSIVTEGSHFIKYSNRSGSSKLSTSGYSLFIISNS